MSKVNYFFIVIVVPLFVIVASGCDPQPDFDSAYTRISEGTFTLQAENDIPLPQGETILTITGQINAHNEGNSIVMDLSTIEAVGLVEYTVEDPFEERQRTFRGVLMKDLLDLWQVDSQATVLEITALNDYKVEVPISMLREFPIIFALQQDGEYMTPDYRGPAMLVLPYGYYEFEHLITNAYWIWQIKSVFVK